MFWRMVTTLVGGWNSKATFRLQKLAERHHRHLFWCHFHGCAYGLEYNNYPVQKSWTVATTDRNVWLALQRKCPGHHEHLHCRGVVAQASSYYPYAMVRAVTRAISSTWTSVEEKAGSSIGRDACRYLLDFEDAHAESLNMLGFPMDLESLDFCSREDQLCQEEPQVLALTRKRMPMEMPSGKALEQIKSQMLRVHKASGHSSFANLQRLLRARQAPAWAVALAGQVSCPECAEAKAPKRHLASSRSSGPTSSSSSAVASSTS